MSQTVEQIFRELQAWLAERGVALQAHITGYSVRVVDGQSVPHSFQVEIQIVPASPPIPLPNAAPSAEKNTRNLVK